MKRTCAAVAMALSLLVPVLTSMSAAPAGAGPPPSPSTKPIEARSPGSTYTRVGNAAAAAGGANARSSPPYGNATATAGTAGATFTPPPNDDFVFAFGPEVSPGKRAVFAAAAGIWSSVLEVEVPIQVDVRAVGFDDAGILGGATPTGLYANETYFPLTDVWFVPAQANQFASRDLDPSTPEISVQISTDYDFYEGVDDQVPPDQISLLTLALHELGHGLGHTTLTTVGSSGSSITVRGLPLVYDSLLLNASRIPLTELASGPLRAALTDRVMWGGSEGAAADGGFYPELYAPGAYVAGSSTSHLDEGTYTDQLMTPFISNGESQLAVPALTQAMFADFGWGLEVDTQVEAFVTAVYRDFLRFFPTPTETTAVVAQLQSGRTTRQQFVTAFGHSDGYVGQLVDGYYLSTLGRSADPTGKQTWLDAIADGMTPAGVAARIYASQEYFNKAGRTNRAWITDLYREILEREPDPGGLDAWTSSADHGTPRSTIALRFYQSYESRRTRVTNLYQHLLKRDPDAGGLQTWTNVLADGRDVELAISLASSAEYLQRAAARYAG